MLATMRARSDVVKMLVDGGADTEQKDAGKVEHANSLCFTVISTRYQFTIASKSLRARFVVNASPP
jgi:hypothetical protein